MDRVPMNRTGRENRRPYSEDRHWDVFVSYKTEDVDIVRRIANQLIASGLKVWFNEYQVLLQNYDYFQEAINFGISHCERAIVFTNNRYINSQYCLIEIDLILKKLQPENILEVMIPKESLPHERYPQLADCPGYIGRECEGILTFIQKTTQWRVKTLVPCVFPSERADFLTVCRGLPVSLDISDWEVLKLGHCIGGSVRGLELSCKSTYNQSRLLVNLFCGPEISDDGQRIEQTKDDRQMFRALMQYASKHIERVDGEEFGLHLFFIKELSQFVATYRMKHYWSRKYSIIIPNAKTQKMAEFVFTAGFDGTFEDYCLHVHLADNLVKSLRWL